MNLGDKNKRNPVIKFKINFIKLIYKCSKQLLLSTQCSNLWKAIKCFTQKLKVYITIKTN